MSSETSSEDRLTTNYSHISDEHYAAIGRAICTYADFEFMIDRAGWRLVGAEQAPFACFSAQYHSIFNRISVLISLVSLFGLSADAVKRLNKLRGDLSGLNEERNRIVHDTRFTKNTGRVIRFEVIAKSALEFGQKEESIDSLHDFCQRVDDKRREFLAIWHPILKLIEEKPELLDVQFARIDLVGLETSTQPSLRGSRPRPPGERMDALKGLSATTPPARPKKPRTQLSPEEMTELRAYQRRHPTRKKPGAEK